MNSTDFTHPTRPDLVEPDPQQSILALESDGRRGSKGDLALMAEDQVLDSDVTVGAESDKESANEQEKELKHSAR